MGKNVDDVIARLERYRDTLRAVYPTDGYNVGVADGLQVAITNLRQLAVDEAYASVAEAERVFGC